MSTYNSSGFQFRSLRGFIPFASSFEGVRQELYLSNGHCILPTGPIVCQNCRKGKRGYFRNKSRIYVSLASSLMEAGRYFIRITNIIINSPECSSGAGDSNADSSDPRMHCMPIGRLISFQVKKIYNGTQNQTLIHECPILMDLLQVALKAINSGLQLENSTM